jgi:1-acyl-sn-glycerol-3-phosphate acyltransferase
VPSRAERGGLRRRAAALRRRLHALELGWRLAGPPIEALLRVAYRIEVVGAEHLPRTGAALVVANHVGSLDPLVIAIVLRRLGRHPRFVALADLYRVPVTGQLVRLARVIPVRRGQGVSQIVEPVCAALDAGHLVVIYPEGTIARPDAVSAGRPGVGEIALRTTAPILPLAQWGTHRGARRWPPLRRPVTLVLGPPVELPPARSADRRARRVEVSTALLARVRALLPRAQALTEGALPAAERGPGGRAA